MVKDRTFAAIVIVAMVAIVGIIGLAGVGGPIAITGATNVTNVTEIITVDCTTWVDVTDPEIEVPSGAVVQGCEYADVPTTGGRACCWTGPDVWDYFHIVNNGNNFVTKDITLISDINGFLSTPGNDILATSWVGSRGISTAYTGTGPGDDMTYSCYLGLNRFWNSLSIGVPVTLCTAENFPVGEDENIITKKFNISKNTPAGTYTMIDRISFTQYACNAIDYPSTPTPVTELIVTDINDVSELDLDLGIVETYSVASIPNTTLIQMPDIAWQVNVGFANMSRADTWTYNINEVGSGIMDIHVFNLKSTGSNEGLGTIPVVPVGGLTVNRPIGFPDMLMYIAWGYDGNLYMISEGFGQLYRLTPNIGLNQFDSVLVANTTIPATGLAPKQATCDTSSGLWVPDSGGMMNEISLAGAILPGGTNPLFGTAVIYGGAEIAYIDNVAGGYALTSTVAGYGAGIPAGFHPLTMGTTIPTGLGGPIKGATYDNSIRGGTLP